MTAELELPGGRRIALDEHGHLCDFNDWTPEVADALARVDGLILTEDHWSVMRLVAHYYREHGIEIPMRALVGRLREAGCAQLAGSRQLYRLFPEGPVRQGSRYAGLPIPLSCI